MTVSLDLLAPISAAPPDRRRSARFKPLEPISTIIGRGSGALLDLSATGARIRHTAAVVLGAQVRVTFEWKRERFEAVAEVLASRVAGIGGGTHYESRLRFVALTPAAEALLERILADLGDCNLRKWVANLRGWSEEGGTSDGPDAAPVRTFVRCRFVNGRWEQRRTQDSSVPLDGFTVAAGTEPSEIRALCRTFETGDAEARRLLQLMTSAVLEQVAG